MVAGMVNDMVSRSTSKRRHVPPSRLKYEASHPTISIRVDRELYDELKALKDTTGLSVAQVLKIGREKAQIATDEGYEKGHRMGFEKGQRQGLHKGRMEGFESAEKKYAVSYHCGRCGERHLTIQSSKAKEAAADAMLDAGWYDPNCVRQ